jgi:glycerophosphoryl diester phosphodiesterase
VHVVEPAEPERRYYAIAHRAGNNLHHLEEALHAGVDAIECDLWHADGRLAVRHERKLPGLPVLYDRWYIRWAWGELNLRALLREIDFRSDLFLDIKSATLRAAEPVLALCEDNESMLPRTMFCSRHWRLLDRLAAAETGMRMFYSVGKRREIAPLLDRCRRPMPPAGTSIRHTLLSRELVAELHAAGLQVFAWVVNNRNRLDELVAWGVDGIIADDVSVFAAAG